MLISTEAIALSSIKYSETSLIVKCFTLSDGVKSYLIKGIRSQKKKSFNVGLFQPLTILEIDANHRNLGRLESIRSAKIVFPYKSIPFDIIKNTIVLFLSEILSKSIQEEEKNENLYNYILGIADNSLILGQRMGELCGHGPSLETDIACTNISLDLFGQVRSYFQYAAKIAGDGRTEDDIAMLRKEREYKNVLLVEQPNTEFAFTIGRQFLFDVYHLVFLTE